MPSLYKATNKLYLVNSKTGLVSKDINKVLNILGVDNNDSISWK